MATEQIAPPPHLIEQYDRAVQRAQEFDRKNPPKGWKIELPDLKSKDERWQVQTELKLAQAKLGRWIRNHQSTRRGLQFDPALESRVLINY